MIDRSDHVIDIRSYTDPRVLSGVPPEKILRHRQSMMPLVEWQAAKEAEDRFSWTIGLYGTEAMAAEAGISIESYWEQIVAACYLDEADPVACWRRVDAEIAEHCAFLNELAIDRLHVEGEDVDLWLTLGEKRKWIGGGGRNIPSFEVVSPPAPRTGAGPRDGSASASRSPSTAR